MSQLSDLALQEAITQIGQQEKPLKSNWGHPVQDYLASVGINFPASWCMAFMYWCFDHASGQVGIPNPLFKTGGVLAQWNNRKDQQISVFFNPERGYVFIMDFGNGTGHTGIVESVDADGTLHTIEGNSNDTGSREGIEVVRHTRNPKTLKGYLSF